MSVRHCPRCHSDRPFTEFYCQGIVDGRPCGWDLSAVAIQPAGGDASAQAAPPATGGHCPNGHAVTAGDLICATCGEDVIAGPSSEMARTTPEPARPLGTHPVAHTTLDGWQLASPWTPLNDVWEMCEAVEAETGRGAVFHRYELGSEPDPDVHDVLQAMDTDHVPRLLHTGRHDGRCYELWERIDGGALADHRIDVTEDAHFRRLVDELARALADLTRVGLRHRDLSPDVIQVRSHDPLDLVITGFGSAQLSEYDLEVVAPLETSRYMAPEAIIGGVSPASDWWSLGVILLELVTGGRCFEGVNEKALLIRAVADGMPLPDGLPHEIEHLLRGLLARDRTVRWQGDQVSSWLRGEPVAAPVQAESPGGVAVIRKRLGGEDHARFARYAYTAATEAHWNEASEQLLRGELATWLEASGARHESVVALRQITQQANLDEDVRLGLALTVLAPHMPLTARGSLVTPAWLLQNLDAGYRLISGPAPALLEGRESEAWLARLQSRAEAVRKRAAAHEIALDEDRLRPCLLTTSRAVLAARWETQRKLLPDTDHRGLVSIVGRQPLREEDLIVLLGAAIGQYRSRADVLHDVQAYSEQNEIPPPDASRLSAWLDAERVDVVRDVDARLEGFARCGLPAVDAWADTFRLDRRLCLAEALVLLSIPADRWQRPDHQIYCAELLAFFERKVSFAITRGPLVRMVIGKNSARIDVTELGTDRLPPQAIVDRLLERSTSSIDLDPEAFNEVSRLESRIRRLKDHNDLYRRDTGIDGLYLGFPFVVAKRHGTTHRPRIAPVLMWPVRIISDVGRFGVHALAFDCDREEVRLNPALESFLSPTELERWSEAAKRARVGGRVPWDVLDAFGDLATPDPGPLGALPPAQLELEVGSLRLANAAVVFHVTFMAQALLEDLRQLEKAPPVGTALATALRIGEEARPETDEAVAGPSYHALEIDPSQERVVLAARRGPGLVVEGPPGTGKSQTIVNVITDAIGHQKSVLVVCQKQAALDVVRKRLAAEGLGDRLAMVVDPNRDRRTVIQSIREQIEAFEKREDNRDHLKRQRQLAADRLATLERDLNLHHEQLYRSDERTGLSYRQMIADLVALETGEAPPLDLPALRAVLVELDEERLIHLLDECAPLIPLWIDAEHEGSPLVALAPFAWDTPTVAAFLAELDVFIEVEEARVAAGDRAARVLDLPDPDAARRWLSEHRNALDGLGDDDVANLARWAPLFTRDPGNDTRAASARRRLDQGSDSLGEVADQSFDAVLASALSARSTPELEALRKHTGRLLSPAGQLGWLKPARLVSVIVVRITLRRVDEGADSRTAADLARALDLEHAMRPWRIGISASLRELGEPSHDLERLPPSALRARATVARDVLDRVAKVRPRLESCPRYDDVLAAVATGSVAATQTTITILAADLRISEARTSSLAALQPLRSTMQDSWIDRCTERIASGAATTGETEAIRERADRIAPYQLFRARTSQLAPEGWSVLRALQGARDELAARDRHEVAAAFRRLVRREARLAWKNRLEVEQPLLLQDIGELEDKVRRLATADEALRDLNRRVLAEDIDPACVRDSRWEGITRYTGPRAYRLREFIKAGANLGLMTLRPVWLMNPSTVSRVLPLRAGMFDTVIFDEASQMPVEYALSALYRARVVVISGDEKQLPPTAFFSSRIEIDEAEVFDGEPLDEDATDAEREAAEAAWNQREVKDCPDLLSLGRTALRNNTLEIHYRSRFRELIDFSNACFYRWQLHVPVTHPDAKIALERPIRLIRVDGVYAHQTNPEEAERVVDLLRDLWEQDGEAPTAGVVTFNRKQADLIIERLDARANEDPSFRVAYARELQRSANGEDVGFFVKNVENVQGDERDVIVFSSTFGRNARGVFRRNFGVLGQRGGERRLNVAVTRARNRIVLVTSIPIEEVSDLLATGNRPIRPRDYFQAYLEYARRMSEGELDLGRGLLGQLGGRPEQAERSRVDHRDEFREQVAAFVEKLGWTPVRGHNDGPFALDLAIEDPATGHFGIGIECDPPRSRLLKTARAREIWRPRVLKGSIPVLHRVWSRRWYADRAGEQQRLERAIAQAMRPEQA